jgi:anti-sigma factor RsiW
MTCRSLDPFFTPYVDGELDAADRAALDAHLRVCPPCHARVAAEQNVRALLQARKSALQKECASPALRAKCAGMAAADLPPSRRWRFGESRRSSPVFPASVGGKVRTTPETSDVVRTFRSAVRPAPSASTWRARLTPFALAASLVVIVGGAFVYQLTDRSVRVMAAELTADHVKCFGMNRLLGTHDAALIVEGSIASSFGWPLHLPDRPERAGLELIGARPCLYGEGRVAHIMYRHNGHPVSVFMLPKTSRAEELVEVMGHEAAIWSVGDRTFVLIAREPRGEVERMASFVHAGLR